MDEISPEMAGPYSIENGRCSYGHPVNAYGRCALLNDGQEPDGSEESGGSGELTPSQL
jgi:hypothetical protein